MKVLKIIGMLLIFVLIAFLAMGFFGAKNYQVERSTIIDASAAKIFPHVQYFKQRDAWSPWSKKDPNMKQSVEGNDGTVGAMHSWDGDPKTVGIGQETITAIKPNERVETKLEFKSPQESNSDAYVQLDAADKGTKVTWGFKGETSFVERIMFTLMSLDKMVGPDFEAGLVSLKEVVESEKTSKRTFDIKEVNHSGKSYVANRQTVKMENIQQFYAANLPNIFNSCKSKNMEMDGMPSGLFYAWDEENGQTDMAAGVPVKKAVDLGDDMKAINIPAGKSLVIDYYGSYEGTADAHYAMEDYMKQKGYKFIPPCIEEYITDPTSQIDVSKRLTKIYYFVE